MASLWEAQPSEGILNVKSPPPEIRLQVENFVLEAFDPFLFPEAKIATEKLRQELKLVEHRLPPKVTMSEYGMVCSATKEFKRNNCLISGCSGWRS